MSRVEFVAIKAYNSAMRAYERKEKRLSLRVEADSQIFPGGEFIGHDGAGGFNDEPSFGSLGGWDDTFMGTEVVIPSPVPSGRKSSRNNCKSILCEAVFITFILDALNMRQVNVSEDLKCNDKLRKRTDKTIMVSLGQLKTALGKFFCRMERHFALKRPGKVLRTDCNLSALRMFVTLISEV